MANKQQVYIGFSPNELEATVIAEASLRGVSGSRVNITRVSRWSLWGSYARPTVTRDGGLWDVISDAPMSTDHAIARFFVPYLQDYKGWALFTDGDVIFRRDVSELFEQADPKYAVMVVPHYAGGEQVVVKKSGDAQTAYARKNWSSVMLFNCAHESNKWLTLERLNSVPGRDLHRFCWLVDDEIGLLHARWNYLVGVTTPAPVDPAICHFTLGVPTTPGHEHDPFATEWYEWARVAGYEFQRPAPTLIGAVSGQR